MNTLTKQLTVLAVVLSSIIAASLIADHYVKAETINPIFSHTINDFKNDQGHTFIGTVNNTNPYQDITVNTVYLEIYNTQNKLIGNVENYQNMPIDANGFGTWKITVTDNDVTNLNDIANVVSGATYYDR